MKKMLGVFCLIYILSTINIKAQSVGINSDNSAPNNSAMLDVKSASKGFLMPHLTQAQREAVTVPATGLMVYQTDGAAGFYYYNGSSWIMLGTDGPAGATGPTGSFR